MYKTNEGKYVVYSDARCSLRQLDLNRNKSELANVKKNKHAEYTELSGTPFAGSVLPFSQMLPFISKHYTISDDPRDYILQPVITMISEVPNRNIVAFTNQILKEFNPDQGRLGYQTWINKPTFIEHDNTDITKSVGFIVDANLSPLNGYNNNKFLKVLKLLAFDRTKESHGYVKDLEERKLNSVSMGALVSNYNCSICGAEPERCNHVSLKDRSTLRSFDGKLAYFELSGVMNAIETSLVRTPAFAMAFSDTLMKV